MGMEIFGYKFADIQRAQQGGRLNRVIDTSLPRNGDINSAEFQRAGKARAHRYSD